MINSADSWVTTELQSADFGDDRLTKRFVAIATRFASKFGSNISSSFFQWKDIKATYRFFENKKITIDAMLEPHIKETIKRIQTQKKFS